jgi:membrane protease subunit (stomatin/prohibitin family)
MSRTSEVIKNKNRVEKLRRARHRNEILSLRARSLFKAKMYDELKHVEVILNDEDVDAVVVDVPDKFISQFTSAIYSEDLAGYDITQVENESNKFYIRRKFITF